LTIGEIVVYTTKI